MAGRSVAMWRTRMDFDLAFKAALDQGQAGSGASKVAASDGEEASVERLLRPIVVPSRYHGSAKPVHGPPRCNSMRSAPKRVTARPRSHSIQALSCP